VTSAIPPNPPRLALMAVTAQERKLLIGGEWVETGDWVDVASPYSGETVGRVAKAGADEARRAIDAAEAAMSEPLPAHKRAEILVRVAGYLGKRHDEAARPVSEGAAKPMTAPRVEADRASCAPTVTEVQARPPAQRPRRAGYGDQRRPRGGRARQGDHLPRLRSGRLAARRARCEEARQPRAR